MKSLLSDILNEIISGYKKLIATTTEETGENTKETATNRLRLVLMHDRTNLAPETMEKMRDELLEVISKYVVVDEELLDLNLASEGDAIALLASIPIVRAKTKEEQEEAIKALEEKRQKEAEAIESEETEDETEEESEEDNLSAEDIDSEELADDEAEAFDEEDKEEAEFEELIGGNLVDDLAEEIKEEKSKKKK